MIILIAISLIIGYDIEMRFFTPREEIKILSYNIHSGFDKNMFPTLFETIDFLRGYKSDIICLQEVNESAKVGFQVSSFKEELDMNAHFGANVVKLGSNYGLVTYSKYPIKKKNHIYLSSEREQRGILHTVVSINRKKVDIINVHLGLGEERKEQMKELVDFIKSLDSQYYIVVGDFNEGNISVDGKILKDVAKEIGNTNILTFPTGLDRIDYIFVSPKIEILDYEVLIRNMSDHYPIMATLKL